MGIHVCKPPTASKDREIWNCSFCNVSWIWRETRDAWIWMSKKR